MSIRQWTVGSRFDDAIRKAGDEAGTLAYWAVWAVDSVDYLEKLDEEAFGTAPHRLQGFQSDTVDLAHARWSASTAITAVDLAAAAIARKLGLPAKRKGEYDVVGLKNVKPSLVQPVQGWIDAVEKDPDYALLVALRHPLVHRRLTRVVSGGTRPPGPHEQRLAFKLPSGEVPARTVVQTAGPCAFRHVDALLVLFADGII